MHLRLHFQILRFIIDTKIPFKKYSFFNWDLLFLMKNFNIFFNIIMYLNWNMNEYLNFWVIKIYYVLFVLKIIDHDKINIRICDSDINNLKMLLINIDWIIL